MGESMNELFRAVKEKRILVLLTLLQILFFTATVFAQTPENVTTYHDNDGWKLLVDGQDYFVKGVVWGYTPIGENYAYNLYGNTDAQIEKVLDYECNLMKKAGINTIRCFGIIPPKWVSYMYNKHGIMSIVNHLMGRYGYNVGGVWTPQINYSDELTRKTLKRDIVELVKKYKDTPGVIMFALGNESNYGLEWSSFEIENLPVGEQHKEKAKYLYSLYNEIIVAGKEIDSNHPFLIVNGDIQYLDLIVKYCPDLDILGVNAYRGVSFTDMWSRVEKELGLPVMLTEFGSDAFNAVEYREDQPGQAEIVKGNWQEIYNKGYGKEEEGNAIGGCVFEWRDEWWKYLQTENLTIQDKHASWSNGGYSFDFVQGKNNMNEEWYGICRLAGPNEDLVYKAEPRMAYDVLSKIWAIDFFHTDKKEMNAEIDNIDMNLLAIGGEVSLLKSELAGMSKFRLSGGSLSGEMTFSGISLEVENNGKNGIDFSNGEMLDLDFEFQPTNHISGNFTINILSNVVDKPLEQYYGKRGVSYIIMETEINDAGMEVTTSREVTDAERVEIYDFEALYSTDRFDLRAFYHVPRYHWGYKGDIYGLLYEATDMEGMDIWNAKAPYGFEFTGKQTLNGLTVLAGPEVYWGANPKALFKYDFGFKGFNFTLIHAEDFSRADASSTATESTERATRQTALSLKTNIIPRITLEFGYLMAGTEKLDEEYDYFEDENIYQDKIELKDTQGARAKISYRTGFGILDVSANYAGLVADGGNPLREFNTTIPYSTLGNKLEFVGGMLIPIGNVWLLPRGLYRQNLLDSNPIIDPYIEGSLLYPGISPRNRDDDPFAVLDNREAVSGEFFITYDPTPASDFYAWDADKREDAGFAFSIGGNFTSYKKDADADMFFYQEGNTNASFGVGMPAEDVWLAKGRFILNPSPNFKLIANLEAGKQQATGNPDGDAAELMSLDAKMIFQKKYYLSGYVKKDAWGPYDWYRQFNITYPLQVKLDYSILIDNMLDGLLSSRIGLNSIYRTLDENSPTNESDGEDSEYEFQAGFYYSIEF
jgi:beta-galactosidase